MTEEVSMSRFASKEIVVISADDEPLDRVHIYAEATLGMERRINKRFLTMQGQAGSTPTLSMDPTEYNFATLCEFIVRWEGPGFEGRKFSEAALAEIGADDPLIVKVLKHIQGRNPKFADADEEALSPNLPQPAESDGDVSLEAPEESGQVSGTYTSSLPIGTVGLPT